MYINFISSKDTIFMYGVITKKLGRVMKLMILLMNCLNVF